MKQLVCPFASVTQLTLQMKVNPNKGAHEADVECPCFHCFMTSQEPAFAKAPSICKVFHKWCGQDKYDWARALFAHLQYLLQSNEPLVPHLEKIIDEGLPQHFLAMLSDDYFDYLPTGERYLLETITSQKTPSNGLIAACTLGAILSLNNNKAGPRTADLIIHTDGLQILCRAVHYGSILTASEALRVINLTPLECNLRSVFESDHIRSLLLQASIHACKITPEVIKNESPARTQNDESLFVTNPSLKDVSHFVRAENMYQYATKILQFITLAVPEYQALYLVEPELVEQLVKHGTRFSHVSLPESSTLLQSTEALGYISSLPYQLEDTSNDYEQLLLDIFAMDSQLANKLSKMLKALEEVNDSDETVPKWIQERAKYAYYVIPEPTVDSIRAKFCMVERNILANLASLSYLPEFATELAKDEHIFGNVCFTAMVLEFPEELRRLGIEPPQVPPMINVKRDYDLFGTTPIKNLDTRGLCICIIRNLGKAESAKRFVKCAIKHQNYKTVVMTSSQQMRELGVELLTRDKSQHQEAMHRFSLGLRVLPRPGDIDDYLLTHHDVKIHRVALLSNRAEMFLQLKKPREAIIDLEIALAIDPKHEKSLRRMERAKKALL